MNQRVRAQVREFNITVVWQADRHTLPAPDRIKGRGAKCGGGNRASRRLHKCFEPVNVPPFMRQRGENAQARGVGARWGLEYRVYIYRHPRGFVEQGLVQPLMILRKRWRTKILR